MSAIAGDPSSVSRAGGGGSAHHSQPAGEPTLAELLTTMQEQSARLVRAELQLAKAEMRAKSKIILLGGGAFGAAGVAGFFAACALVAAAILGLAVAIPPWLAALAIGGLLAIFAGLAAVVGLAGVKQALPLVPERTRASISDDLGAIKPSSDA